MCRMVVMTCAGTGSASDGSASLIHRVDEDGFGCGGAIGGSGSGIGRLVRLRLKVLRDGFRWWRGRRSSSGGGSRWRWGRSLRFVAVVGGVNAYSAVVGPANLERHVGLHAVVLFIFHKTAGVRQRVACQTGIPSRFL